MNRSAIALLALTLPLSAAAERLRVDALVFQNLAGGEERGSSPRRPDDPRAIALDDARSLAAAGITLLPETSSTLAAEWKALTAARSFKPLLRLSWVQESATLRGGPALRIYLPNGDGIGGLQGWLRLNKGRVEHLTADLEYVQAETTSNRSNMTLRAPLAYRLQERRTVGAQALHYLDSSRIGVLVRVTPAL